MNAIRAYARTQTETASKERLMVLLFEAALRDMGKGRLALQTGSRGEASKLLSHASEIVTELLATLDNRHAPDLCQQLSEIYTFVIKELLNAMLTGQADRAEAAERAFRPVVEGFAEAVKSIQGPTAGPHQP